MIGLSKNPVTQKKGADIMDYPNLFKPYRIKNTRFRNRILNAPNGTKHKTYEGFPVEFEVALYEARAKGGVAQVTTGNTSVTRRYTDLLPGVSLNLEDPNGQPAFTEVALAVKRAGAVPSVELNHPGALAQPRLSGGRNPIGPMGYVRPDGVEVIQMDEALIEEAVEDFANAALYAKQCGFEMCMVHGGHGWLIHSFLSPLTNHRTDAYGGSHENRARFAIQICDRIREKCGDDFLIEFRISACEFIEGGLTVDDAIIFAHLLEDHIDLIHVSAAGLTLANHAEQYKPASYDELTTQFMSSPSPHIADEAGTYVEFAAAVKRSGVKVPVVAVGAINTPEMAEEIIASGKADFVSIARALIADPEFPNKAKRGQRDQITPCIRCERCRNFHYHRQCAVNPTEGRYVRLLYANPSPKRKKVAVVGGGPGGMQAALTAAERGHDVTLYERSAALGGVLSHFSADDYLKREIIPYRDSQIRKLEASGCRILLNTAAAPEDLRAEGYDAIISAVGAREAVPPIPGIDGPGVYNVLELPEKAVLGDRVAVIGGGMSGCETAFDLARTGKQVILIEARDKLFPEVDTASKKYAMPVFVRMVRDENITILRSAKCVAIHDGQVDLELGDGSRETRQVDSVVYSVGSKADTGFVDDIWDCAPDVIPVGDCVQPRSIMDAVREGYFAALNL